MKLKELIDLEESDPLLKCPRCGKVRQVTRNVVGYLNINPGSQHKVLYLDCINPKCDKPRTYLTERIIG